MEKCFFRIRNVYRSHNVDENKKGTMIGLEILKRNNLHVLEQCQPDRIL